MRRYDCFVCTTSLYNDDLQVMNISVTALYAVIPVQEMSSLRAVQVEEQRLLPGLQGCLIDLYGSKLDQHNVTRDDD